MRTPLVSIMVVSHSILRYPSTTTWNATSSIYSGRKWHSISTHHKITVESQPLTYIPLVRPEMRSREHTTLLSQIQIPRRLSPLKSCGTHSTSMHYYATKSAEGSIFVYPIEATSRSGSIMLSQSGMQEWPAQDSHNGPMLVTIARRWSAATQMTDLRH